MLALKRNPNPNPYLNPFPTPNQKPNHYHHSNSLLSEISSQEQYYCRRSKCWITFGISYASKVPLEVVADLTGWMQLFRHQSQMMRGIGAFTSSRICPQTLLTPHFWLDVKRVLKCLIFRMLQTNFSYWHGWTYFIFYIHLFIAQCPYMFCL